MIVTEKRCQKSDLPNTRRFQWHIHNTRVQVYYIIHYIRIYLHTSSHENYLNKGKTVHAFYWYTTV